MVYPPAHSGLIAFEQLKQPLTIPFVVDEILTADPDDPVVFALPPDGEARLTLYTCTPVKIATHRLIVRALRLEK